MQYDAVGNRTTVADITGVTTSCYDALNRLKMISYPANKAITYSYDARGLRDHMIDPDGGRFTYSHDAAGRMAWLENPQSDRTTFSYDAGGRETLKELANGTRASTTYDAASRITLLENSTSAGTIISSFDYDYDSVGNRIGVVEADGDRVTWSYDATYQLIREQRSPGAARSGWLDWELTDWEGWELSDWETFELEDSGGAATITYDHQFTYDPLGNRLVNNIDGALTTSTFDAANQLQTSVNASGMTTYTYDNAGNQQIVESPDASLTTYTWNDENRQTQVELPDATLITNTYYADGLRARKESGADTTHFIYDGQNYLAETDGINMTIAVYTNKPDTYGRLVSQYRWNGSIWSIFDSFVVEIAVSRWRGMRDPGDRSKA